MIRKVLTSFEFVTFSFLIFLANRLKSFKEYLVKNLCKIRDGLDQEREETREMIEIYLKFSQGGVKRSELRKANEQFQDLIRTLGIGTLVILPFAPITLPLVIKLGQALGVEVMPSSFRGKRESD